jgi:hypothetical protein
MKVSIYLAGNVSKINSEEDDSWREAFKKELKEKLDGVDVKFLDPTVRLGHLKDSYSVFAQDIFFTANSDFVIVEAMNKVGIGVGVEMVAAKMHGVPVISVVPKNSYYRSIDQYSVKHLSEEIKNNWLHPFLSSLSDVIVEDLDQAAVWIKEHLNEKKKIKDHSVIEEAIKYYKEHHYHNDDQAKEAFE